MLQMRKTANHTRIAPSDRICPFAEVISEPESGGEEMKTRHGLYLSAATAAVALAFGVPPTRAQVRGGAIQIGGGLSRPDSREAGVWVIAETVDLPTRMTKSVVTD